MATESSGFFNAEYDADNDFWDRVYTSEQFANYFAQLIGNGVFEGHLQVRQYSDETQAMRVRVMPGKAFINGYWYSLEEEAYFDVPVNPTSLTRTDCICLQYNFNDRVIKVVYHNSTSLPVRDGEMYEIMLCTITVRSSVTVISQSDITDTRQMSAVCGIVTGLIDQIDFDTAYSQFTTWFNEYKEEIIDDFSEAGEMAQIIFNAWFNDIKGKLTSDVAGSLQLEIDTQAQMIAEPYSVLQLYDVGARVTYNNSSYECISPVTTYGDFNPSKWKKIQVYEQLKNKVSEFESGVTVFNVDGSITTTYNDRVKNTVFNSNGSITETLSTKNGTVYSTKTTTFNQDGSITETVS